MLFQLFPEHLRQRKSVGYRSCKTGNDGILENLSHFFGGSFHNRAFPHGDLSVTADAHVIAALYRNDSRRMKYYITH